MYWLIEDTIVINYLIMSTTMVENQRFLPEKGAKFDRHCDWWLYKERHLVENYFLKLKAFRPNSHAL